MIFCSLLEDEFLGRDGNLHRRYMKRGAECSKKNAGVGSIIRELGGGSTNRWHRVLLQFYDEQSFWAVLGTRLLLYIRCKKGFEYILARRFFIVRG